MIARIAREGRVSEKRKYRQFTPDQKAEIVIAGLRGDRSVRDVCREYEVSETLYYQWRDRLLEGGKAAFANPQAKTPEQTEISELKKKVALLERRLARRPTSWRSLGELSRDWTGASGCPGPAPWSIPDGKAGVVARPAGVSPQGLYRQLSRRPVSAGPGLLRPGDEAIVEVAKANPVDGTRMVAAPASRELGEPVNRKRVQRLMRAHKLLQRSRNTDRRRRPGFFRVTRPDELWHMDMTKVWTAAHGWVYPHVIVDCCTREVAGWTVDLRARSVEAVGCVEAAILARDVRPAQLTLGTDNGSQFTSRDFRRHLSARGITHFRGGYRDPESQALIGSWFGQFKRRCAWRCEWETIEQARREISTYIDSYQHRSHSGIGYCTPAEVAATWQDPMQDPTVLQTLAT